MDIEYVLDNYKNRDRQWLINSLYEVINNVVLRSAFLETKICSGEIFMTDNHGMIEHDYGIIFGSEMLMNESERSIFSEIVERKKKELIEEYPLCSTLFNSPKVPAKTNSKPHQPNIRQLHQSFYQNLCQN